MIIKDGKFTIRTKIDVALDYLRAFPFANSKQVEDACAVSDRTVRRARLLLKSSLNTGRVLLLDIETSPMEVLVWGLYLQRISPDNVIKEWSVLSWAAKWLFESEVMSGVVTPDDARERKDGRVLKGIWSLINDADIIIAHNAKKFDVRKLNARFILNGLKPPLPYQVIDTLTESRRYFAMSSHKLDYLAGLFSHKRKIKTDYELWKRCINGEKSALKEMVEYNRMDVLVLEEVYVTLRPWMKSHPNMGLYIDTIDTVCSNCSSSELTWCGSYDTQVGQYESFRCQCGAIGRARTTSVSKEKRKLLGVSVAR